MSDPDAFVGTLAAARNIMIFIVGALLFGNLFGSNLYAAGGLGGLALFSVPLLWHWDCGPSWGTVGVMCVVSANVWPDVIVHTMGNLLAWPMTDGAAMLVETPLLFAARSDDLPLIAALLVVAGFALRWETRHEQNLTARKKY